MPRTQADRDDDLQIGRSIERRDAEVDRLRAALHKAGDELKAAACPYASTQAHAAADLNQQTR
jgi:hypothetical protein